MTARKIAKYALLIILGMAIMYLWLTCNGAIKAEAAAVDTDVINGSKRELIEGGAMPCMEVKDELPTSEEKMEEGLPTGDRESSAESTEKESSGPVCAVYTVADKMLPEWIQRYAYTAFERRGIAWWYPYFIAQAFQESSFNLYAVSKDGLDHGLLQYRAMYWGGVSAKHGYSGADIYDPYVQIEIYADQVLDRLNRGLAVEEVISRHKTSDYAPYYDSYYVSCVTRHLKTMTVK